MPKLSITLTPHFQENGNDEAFWHWIVEGILENFCRSIECFERHGKRWIVLTGCILSLKQINFALGKSGIKASELVTA